MSGSPAAMAKPGSLAPWPADPLQGDLAELDTLRGWPGLPSGRCPARLRPWPSLVALAPWPAERICKDKGAELRNVFFAYLVADLLGFESLQNVYPCASNSSRLTAGIHRSSVRKTRPLFVNALITPSLQICRPVCGEITCDPF